MKGKRLALPTVKRGHEDTTLAKTIALTLLSTISALGLASAAPASDASRIKQAEITRVQAEQIALAKVPHGQIKSAEIENEKGHFVWSFDIATAGTKDITEILVDAKSGAIISKQTETPRDQAAEAAADKKK
ncbi:MAG: PepSY domain-containing protein [Chthoniobacterales bacterium]